MEKFKTIKAAVNLLNGVCVPFSLYFAFNGQPLQFFIAGLNAYLFISGFDNIKEQFFSKQEKV